MTVVPVPPAVRDLVTPIQWEAMTATAAKHLRDPEELAAEMAHSLGYADSEPATVEIAAVDSGVKEPLTGACDLDPSPPATLAVTFSTAPIN